MEIPVTLEDVDGTTWYCVGGFLLYESLTGAILDVLDVGMVPRSEYL